MKSLRVLVMLGTVAAMIACAGTVSAIELYGLFPDRAMAYRAQFYPWHGSFYDPAWGMPIALVVPPSAANQTHWGWGVGNTRVAPIDHQFHRGYPGPGWYNRRAYLPTPPWPSDTDQFGVYSLRGPW